VTKYTYSYPFKQENYYPYPRELRISAKYRCADTYPRISGVVSLATDSVTANVISAPLRYSAILLTAVLSVRQIRDLRQPKRLKISKYVSHHTIQWYVSSFLFRSREFRSSPRMSVRARPTLIKSENLTNNLQYDARYDVS